MSLHKRRIVWWLRDNHPSAWVVIGGINLQCSRGLEIDGLVEIRGIPGRYQIRLTDEGRSAPVRPL